MSNVLQVLLMIYSVVLVINFVASLVLLNIHKHNLFKVLCAMWGFSLINFILQGIFLTTGLAMYVSFSSYLLVSFSLYIFVSLILAKDKIFSKTEKNTSILLTLLICTGGVIYQVTQNYFIASFIASVAISIPMAAGGYKLWKSQNGFGPKLLSILLFLNAIHFLDYPILRSYEQGALLGFSIALVLLFGFSTLFPAFVLLQIASSYTEELETKVKDRTEELGNALNFNRTLVNILCHDLANPLTILRFYLYQTTDKICEEEHKHRLAKMKNSLSDILNIVSKVKDLQAITSGKVTLERTKINLKDIINEVISSFEELLIPKNIKIFVTCKIDIQASVFADRDILKNQIFSNLISNAIKFSFNESAINIIISEKDQHILVTIEDMGMGIPQDLLPKIFSWNEKTSRKGTNGEAGTGFGLPLVKTCAAIMGVVIRAESSFKENSLECAGSRFIVQFDKTA